MGTTTRGGAAGIKADREAGLVVAVGAGGPVGGDARGGELPGQPVRQGSLSSSRPERLADLGLHDPGDLYALERVAQNNADQRQTIVNVLCAYLRMPYQPAGTPPGDADATQLAEHREQVQEREVRLTAQRLLSDHLRPGFPHNPAATFWRDPEHNLMNLDLTDAILVDLDLQGCHLRTARFTRTKFAGTASFGKTEFADDARFIEAEVAGDAWFVEAKFTGNVRFGKAEFAGTTSFAAVIFAQRVPIEVKRFWSPPKVETGQSPGGWSRRVRLNTWANR